MGLDLGSQHAGKAAETEKASQLYITTANVNIRSGPGTQYRIVATIEKETRVHVVGRKGEWLRVVSKRGNPPGYIHEKYARPLEESLAGQYVTLRDTFVREGPGRQYKAVSQIPEGVKVTVIEAEGDWLKVQSKRGNPPGYIEKRDARRLPGR